MATEFDPYHRWLGIPPTEQPADRYRLLGLARFEDDAEVIYDAAERQMGHVRRYGVGQHSALSQQILNELAAAKVCLLDPKRKAAYDAQLRSELDARLANSPDRRPDAIPSASPPEPSVAETETESQPTFVRVNPTIRATKHTPPRRGRVPPTRKKRKTNGPRITPQHLLIAGIAAGVVLLVGTVLAFFLSGQRGATEQGPVVAARDAESAEAPAGTQVTADPGTDENMPAARPDAPSGAEKPPEGSAPAKPEGTKETPPSAVPTANDAKPEAKPEVEKSLDVRVPENRPQPPSAPLAPSAEGNQENDAVGQPAPPGTDVPAPRPPVPRFDGSMLTGKQKVVLRTSKGDITLELDADAAPKTVTNFVGLSRAGCYNGLTFHRVIPKFMIHGGDPNGDGTGGESIFGPTFDDETEGNPIPLVRGVIAMANRGPGANGSQFFIITRDKTPWLAGKHTPFGRVTEGMDVVDAISNVPKGEAERPLEAVTFTVEVVKHSPPQSDPLPEPDQEASTVETPTPSSRPDLAVAPFDEKKAKEHQVAWAKHIGEPVEMTNSVGMKLTLIPPGEYKMGTPSTPKRGRTGENPQHLVRVTDAFYMGTCEVTVGQFREFHKSTGYKSYAEKGGGVVGYRLGTDLSDNDGTYPVLFETDTTRRFGWGRPGFPQDASHPVTCVSWQDAEAFCKWLSSKEDRQYALPTEAQWEHACRAGTTTRFFSGENEESLRTVANVRDQALTDQLSKDLPNLPNKYIRQHAPKLIEVCRGHVAPWSDGCPTTAPVGHFASNPFGLYDMHGNAAEWCQDWWDEKYYKASPTDNPRGPEQGMLHVVRGGSWFGGGDSAFWSGWADYMSSASRLDAYSFQRKLDFPSCRIGFRVVTVIRRSDP